MKRRTLLAAGLMGPTIVGTAASVPAVAGASGTGQHELRLKELGLQLPAAPSPVATYVAYRRSGSTLYLAGLGPALSETAKTRGRVGRDLSVAEGYAAARLAGLNVLALLRSACGGTLDPVVQCLRVGAFVASADDFHEQPKVVNGASDLFVEVFGAAGLHTRFAVGVNTLPFDIAVEIESVWEIRA
jgi:enamine deaminase RidA (YjgF/YER057c/UK114 family)